MGNVVTKRWTLRLMACRPYRPPLCIYIMNESLYIVHKIRGGILFLLLTPRANNNNLLVNPNFGVYDATKLREFHGTCIHKSNLLVIWCSELKRKSISNFTSAWSLI